MNRFLSIFQSGKNTLSSKRVCGVLGWIVILFCAITGREVAYMDVLIASTVVLLGVETVTNIFNKNTDGDK